MTPEEAVAARLLAVMPVTAIVDDRVFMLKLPQGENRAALRVQAIPGLRDQHLRGPVGMERTRVQVDSYVCEAPSVDAYAQARTLAAAVRGDGLGASASGLWGWIGELGSPPTRIHNVELLVDGSPEYEADELERVRIRQDYMVHWSET